jgi:hypothetical protein
MFVGSVRSAPIVAVAGAILVVTIVITIAAMFAN